MRAACIADRRYLEEDTVRYIHSLSCVFIGLIATGCTLPDPGNSNDNSDEPTVIELQLGDIGVFNDTSSDPQLSSGFLDITDQLPVDVPTSATLAIDPADVTIGADQTTNGTDVGTNGADVGTNGIDATVTLRIVFAPGDAADPCEAGSMSAEFEMAVENGVATSITPEVAAVNTTGFENILTGQFGICIAAFTGQPLEFTIDTMTLELQPPGPVTASSCAEILALPEVQDAITALAAEGITFTMPTGDSVPDLEGDYDLTQTVVFDPDGTNDGDTVTGSITLDNQTTTSLDRTGFGETITQYLAGDATSIGLCTLERTNDTRCDQTIARLESLQLDANTGGLTGSFISVAVRRHSYTVTGCGARGDFIYGSVELATNNGGSAVTGAQLLGKVELPADFAPGLLIVSPAGGSGIVAGFDRGVAFTFDTVDPFTLTEIPLPTGLDPTGFSAVGIMPDATKLALVTESPNAVVSYDVATLDVIRSTEETEGSFIGARVDFSLDGAQLYVPVTSTNFSDQIRILRAEDNVFGDEVRRLITPQGKTPVRARLSPDGSKLAVLLEAGADTGEAAEITFLDTDMESYSVPPLDLVDAGGGTVLATELEWSADSSQVFLAGLGAVLAVEATDPFTVTSIDVSGGAADNPIDLALSNDGAVLAVAVDDVNSTVDFAVVDVATLTTVHTANLGFPERGVIGVAHFDTDRVALVANFESEVVAVLTEDPYTVYDPLTAAPDSSLVTLDRLSAGGGIIAVTNIDEPAIYLYELP